MDEEDFPRVAVRVGEPDLVLSGKAASDVFVYPLNHPFPLQALFPCRDVCQGLDFDPEMIDRTDTAGG